MTACHEHVFAVFKGHLLYLASGLPTLLASSHQLQAVFLLEFSGIPES